MCGILGVFDLAGKRKFPQKTLKNMLDSLIHRGPDAEGFYFLNGYSTGVRRLKLRDPENGIQPMSKQDSVLSLNGELFSYHTDKNRLISKGCKFITNSDTEVFLLGLINEEIEFLKNLDGQFALSLYNSKQHTLFLARDKFGIAPLFYTVVDNWFIFASEIKAILASQMLIPRLNPIAIDHVLTRMASPTRETCFEGIYSLPPGGYLRITKGGIFENKYFEYQPSIYFSTENNKYRITDDLSFVEKLESLMLDSVERRLEADAEIGLYLSSGVDSSLIAALAANIISPNKRKNLTAYSVQLHNSSTQIDESSFALLTAKYLGIRHIILPIRQKDILENFVDSVFAAEMPVLDHANICMLLLARRAKADGKTAILTGEGADEAFGGYPWHSFPKIFNNQSFSKISSLFSSDLSYETTRIFKNFSQYPLFLGMASIRNLFYNKEFKEKVLDSKENHFPVTTNPAWANVSLLQRSLILDYQWLLAGHLLADKGDRVSMAASIETRYPFLDKDVFAFASGLDDKLKLRNNKNKWLLRAVAEKYLPKETAWRKKHLFRAEPLIHGPNKPKWVEQLLSPDSILATGLFDPALVTKNLKFRQKSHLFSMQESFIQVGLSGVVSTQLLFHLFSNFTLCDLPKK